MVHLNWKADFIYCISSTFCAMSPQDDATLDLDTGTVPNIGLRNQRQLVPARASGGSPGQLA